MLRPRAVLFAGLCLAAVAATPSTARAAAGPVAAYGFEDAAPATAGDSSVFGNTGSVQGAARTAGRSRPATGRCRSAATRSGASGSRA